jgi:hypothetical protein
LGSHFAQIQKKSFISQLPREGYAARIRASGRGKMVTLREIERIELFGLTCLQKVTDSVTKGALHIEPGIWIHIRRLSRSRR